MNQNMNKMPIDLRINFTTWTQTCNKVELVFRLSRPVRDNEFIFVDCDDNFFYVYIMSYDESGKSEVKKTYRYPTFKKLKKGNCTIDFDNDFLNVHLVKGFNERWNFWQKTF